MSDLPGLVPSRAEGNRLSIVERPVLDLSTPERLEIPWLDIPRESPLWTAADATGGTIYCVSAFSASRHTIVEGTAVRTGIIALPDGCACRPVASPDGLVLVDMRKRLARLSFKGMELAPCLVPPPPAVRYRQVGVIPSSFHGAILDMVGTARGYLLVHADGILETGHTGTPLAVHPFPGFLAGFSFDPAANLGFARDHNRRLFAFRPGTGFGPASAQAAGLPRAFSYSSDHCSGPDPDGWRPLWMLSAKTAMTRIKVRVAGDLGLELAPAESIKLEGRIVSSASRAGRIAVLLATERLFSGDMAAPTAEPPGTAVTGLAESRFIQLADGMRPMVISRYERITSPEGRINVSVPIFAGARISALEPDHLVVDTVIRRRDLERRGCRTRTESPNACPGNLARLLASGREVLAFDLGGDLVVTDRDLEIMAIAREARAIHAAVDGFTVAWSPGDRAIMRGDARAGLSRPETFRLHRPVRAFVFGEAFLWAGNEGGADLYDLPPSTRTGAMRPRFGQRLGITPSAIARGSDPTRIAAVEGNRAVLAFPGKGPVLKYLGDDLYHDAAIDTDALLVAGTTGLLRLESATGALLPSARAFVGEYDGTVFNLGNLEFDGSLEGIRWYRLQRWPFSGEAMPGSLEPVPADEEQDLSDLWIGPARI